MKNKISEHLILVVIIIKRGGWQWETPRCTDGHLGVQEDNTLENRLLKSYGIVFAWQFDYSI